MHPALCHIIRGGKILVEKLTVAQLVKKFPPLYDTRSFITVFTKTNTGWYPESHTSIGRIHTIFPLRSFSHLCRDLVDVLFSQIFLPRSLLPIDESCALN